MFLIGDVVRLKPSNVCGTVGVHFAHEVLSRVGELGARQRKMLWGRKKTCFNSTVVDKPALPDNFGRTDLRPRLTDLLSGDRPPVEVGSRPRTYYPDDDPPAQQRDIRDVR